MNLFRKKRKEYFTITGYRTKAGKYTFLKRTKHENKKTALEQYRTAVLEPNQIIALDCVTSKYLFVRDNNIGRLKTKEEMK